MNQNELELLIESGHFFDYLAKEGANCVATMQPEYVSYKPGESVTFKFPILEMFLNPRRSMQGGFVGAAFDNVFGILVLLETKRKEMATIDLSVNYIKPIFVGDELYITTYIKSKGNTICSLYGEAKNKEGKLIATSTTNIMLIQQDNFKKKED